MTEASLRILWLCLLAPIIMLGGGLAAINAHAQEVGPKTGLEKIEVPPSEPASKETAAPYPDEPVVVENAPLVWDNQIRSYRLPHYRYRKSVWGLYLQVGAHNYVPDAIRTGRMISSSDKRSWTNPSFLTEIQISPRLGSAAGSLALDLGATRGSYQAGSAGVDFVQVDIQLYRVAARWIFDTLFKNPYVAPYAGAGFYMVMFEETLTRGPGKSGQTEPGTYGVGGLAFSLNWLDQDQADYSYTEFGLENSYLFVEARNYLGSSGGGVPDLGGSLSYAAGLQVEF